MKKKMTRLVARILTFIMVLFLVGCGGEQQKFVGNWEAEVDMTKMLNDQFAAEDAEMAEIIKVESFKVTMIMQFNSDGTYMMSVDADSVEAAFEGLLEDVKKGLTTYLEAMIQEQGITMTVDEVLALSGTSMDTMLDEMMKEISVEDIVGEIESEGNFLVEDGKLFLSDGKDHAVDREVYQTYEWSGNDLKLTASYGEDEDVSALYPMLFKKVN